MADLSIYKEGGLRTLNDYMKNNRAAAINEQLERKKLAIADLTAMTAYQKALKDEKEAADPSMMFKGNGFDQQVGNVVYQDLLARGVPPETAKKITVDTLLGNKQRVHTDSLTGQQVVTQGQPIFGRGNHDLNLGEANNSENKYYGPNHDPDNPPNLGGLPAVFGGAKKVENPNYNPRGGTPAPVNPREDVFGAHLPPDIEEKGKTLYESTEGSGWQAAIRAATAHVAGQFGQEVFPQTIADRQNLDLGSRSLIRAMQKSKDYSFREMDSLEDDISIKTSFFTSPVELKVRMREIRRNIEKRVKNSFNIYNDPSVPVEYRRTARRDIEEMSNFLEMLGVPDDAYRTADQPPENLPNGGKFLGFK